MHPKALGVAERGADHVPRPAPGVACWSRTARPNGTPGSALIPETPVFIGFSARVNGTHGTPQPESACNHGAYGRARGHKSATNGPQGRHQGATRCRRVQKGGHRQPDGHLGARPRAQAGRPRSVTLLPPRVRGRLSTGRMLVPRSALGSRVGWRSLLASLIGLMSAGSVSVG